MMTTGIVYRKTVNLNLGGEGDALGQAGLGLQRSDPQKACKIK
jgi:hypothetical protein